MKGVAGLIRENLEAFAVAITEGMVVEEAVRFANAAGAVTVMRPGAQPALPTRGEVVRMLGR